MLLWTTLLSYFFLLVSHILQTYRHISSLMHPLVSKALYIPIIIMLSITNLQLILRPTVSVNYHLLLLTMKICNSVTCYQLSPWASKSLNYLISSRSNYINSIGNIWCLTKYSMLPSPNIFIKVATSIKVILFGLINLCKVYSFHGLKRSNWTHLVIVKKEIITR